MRSLALLSMIASCAATLPAGPTNEKSAAAQESAAAPSHRQPQDSQPSPGSLWSPGARLNDLAVDLRARRPGDLLTILVVERASAVARGTSKTSRSASAKASVGALAGPLDPAGRLANLVDLGSQSQLDGQGETSRETVLRTTLTARVIEVLPNGNLVIEAAKQVTINSERQLVRVRGIARPFDVTPANTVYSDQLADMEVAVNGRGVVGDAIRRPNFLYRILLGILPF